MLKKMMFLSLCGVAFVSNAQAFENFDKGSNFGECLSNCREYHREELQLQRGAGKGMCWDICSKEHSMTEFEMSDKNDNNSNDESSDAQ